MDDKERIQEIVVQVRNVRIHGAESLWNVARERMLRDRGALPEEEGDIEREYKTMHEEHFLSSWPREDVEGIQERKKNREEWQQRGGRRENGCC